MHNDIVREAICRKDKFILEKIFLSLFHFVRQRKCSKQAFTNVQQMNYTILLKKYFYLLIFKYVMNTNHHKYYYYNKYLSLWKYYVVMRKGAGAAAEEDSEEEEEDATAAESEEEEEDAAAAESEEEEEDAAAAESEEEEEDMANAEETDEVYLADLPDEYSEYSLGTERALPTSDCAERHTNSVVHDNASSETKEDSDTSSSLSFRVAKS
ncbi:conserved Plasmodium protein, unknown function [Plasmodium ovale wallikeri]|uniref:Uncharacterized protein n=1 Tax=Plasmodium ovale wallikeri TaxID=864142 RepID=A0A1A8YFU3_PLAOA|nr:conserved Plasmodium protein, unknown function [Plasmodium ovale wallikeri]